MNIAKGSMHWLTVDKELRAHFPTPQRRLRLYTLTRIVLVELPTHPVYLSTGRLRLNEKTLSTSGFELRELASLRKRSTMSNKIQTRCYKTLPKRFLRMWRHFSESNRSFTTSKVWMQRPHLHLESTQL